MGDWRGEVSKDKISTGKYELNLEFPE